MNMHAARERARWTFIIRIFLAAAAQLAAAVAVRAQVMTEPGVRMPFPGARAIAMGDAYTSEVSDVSMIFWNPGALPQLEQRAVVMDHAFPRGTGVMNDVVAAPVWQGPFDAIAIGGVASSIGSVAMRGGSTPRLIQTEGDIGYGRIFAPGFSAGVRATARHTSFDGTRRWSGSWAAGIAYYPSPEVSYGAVFQDGLSGVQVAGSPDAVIGSLPPRLQIGISMRFPSSRKRHVFTLALTNEKYFGERGILYKGGVEVYPLGFLALRGGYIIGPNILVSRLGGGIRTSIIQIDYAISAASHEIQFQQITMAVTLK